METHRAGGIHGWRHTHRNGETQAVIVVYLGLVAAAVFLTCVRAPASCCAPTATQALSIAMGSWDCSIAEHPRLSLQS